MFELLNALSREEIQGCRAHRVILAIELNFELTNRLLGIDVGTRLTKDMHTHDTHRGDELGKDNIWVRWWMSKIRRDITTSRHVVE